MLEGVFNVFQHCFFVLGQPSFRKSLLIWQETALSDCYAILMIVGIYEIGSQF